MIIWNPPTRLLSAMALIFMASCQSQDPYRTAGPPVFTFERNCTGISKKVEKLETTGAGTLWSSSESGSDFILTLQGQQCEVQFRNDSVPADPRPLLIGHTGVADGFVKPVTIEGRQLAAFWKPEFAEAYAIDYLKRCRARLVSESLDDNGSCLAQLEQAADGAFSLYLFPLGGERRLPREVLVIDGNIFYREELIL